MEDQLLCLSYIRALLHILFCFTNMSKLFSQGAFSMLRNQ